MNTLLIIAVLVAVVDKFNDGLPDSEKRDAVCARMQDQHFLTKHERVSFVYRQRLT